MNFSLIIPVYNGADFLPDTLRLAGDFLRCHADAELVVVNDGSHDRTREILEQGKQTLPRYRVIHFVKNRGKGAAIKAGMQSANGGWLGFTDADLPYGLTPFVSMQQMLRDDAALALLYGSRSHKQSAQQKTYGIVRTFGRNFFSYIVRWLVFPNVFDTQCGIKLMTKSLAELVLKKSVIDRFAFDVELFAIARVNHLETKDVPVELHHRKESSVRIVKDTLRMLSDIWRIRQNQRAGIYRSNRMPF